MKFINPQVMDDSEKELIASIYAALDLSAIGKILKDKYNLELKLPEELKDGDIVVHNDQVAYKLGFDARLAFSVLMDRMGNYQGFTDKDDRFELPEEKTVNQTRLTDSEIIKRKEGELVDAVAAALNPKDIGAVFEQEHSLTIGDNAEFKQGHIVVYKSQAAYKLDFVTELKFSLWVDRKGNYLAISNSNDRSAIHEQIPETDNVGFVSDAEPSQIAAHASSI